MTNKIFGIGLGRTGTTSLFTAMQILGYRSRHGVKKIDFVQNYDFMNDESIACRFKFLDHIFLKSKFILTIRNLEDWLKSRIYKDSCKYSKEKNNYIYKNRLLLEKLEIRFRLFGTCYFENSEFERDKFIEIYHKHQEDVFDYFKNRREDLLVMNIMEGDGWEKLCPFLNKEIPNISFPYKNKKKIRKK